MPYISKTLRENFQNTLDNLEPIPSPGELNYLITMICLSYLKQHKTSYTMYNETIGVLECAKLELYRKQVSEYEEIKLKENGPL